MKYLNSKHDPTTDYFNETNIGEYKDAYFQLYHKNMFIFESDSSTLVASYSDAEYAKQVEFLNQEITFLEKDEYGVHGNFSINNWDFQVCVSEESNIPKDFAMVAFNDEECKIAYLEFYDRDIDYVSEDENDKDAMVEFVEYYFKYHFQ